MTGAVLLKEPFACTVGERREFERLVRQGFPAAQDLERRIRDANHLAFYHSAGEGLVGVAAIKAPDERYRCEVFTQADAPASADGYPLELGWVFVVPGYRRNGIAELLCRGLVARARFGVFATTRPDNTAMICILGALGFARVGTPYARRKEKLVLYVRHPTVAA